MVRHLQKKETPFLLINTFPHQFINSVQLQAENTYTSRDFNQCVTAQYVNKGYKTFWGYDIGVFNVAAELTSEAAINQSDVMMGDLCAKADNLERGKLKVAPCFLPSWFAGPYWIVDYDEEAGYAIISGGQPNIPVKGETSCGENGSQQCCKTGDGVNNSGLWIFMRLQNPSDELVESASNIAKVKGFATSVLFHVEHPPGCNDIVPDIVPPRSGDGRALRGGCEV
jgi:lipocalin